ncbi:hypothetical protein HYR99_26775 [Candidatus Poribacteria bacterium]|nr:hypothetical protein [Candidatus Poribacteria bacterium]
MKMIRGLHYALLLLLAVVVIGVVGVGCGENTDQPLLETTSDVQSSPLSALSQTNVPQALQMPNDGTMQKPGETMMGMGGMMHQDGNMPMDDDPMEQVEDSRNGEGMEQMPNMNAEDMGKVMEEMMSDEHHQTMSNAMKVMHDAHHQKPAAQPQKPAEPPPAQPGQQVPDEHNQHHQ